MFEALLTVKFLTSKNCFCLLSKKNFKQLSSNHVKIIYNDGQVAHVTVSPTGAFDDDNCIGVNSLFGKACGLEEGALVAISEIPRPPTIKTITVTTLNSDDYQILESLAETVQSTLLEQVQVVSIGQTFVVWVGILNLRVLVCEIQPASPGLLDNLTEMVIKPPTKEKITTDLPKNSVETNLVLRIVPFTNLNIEKYYHPFNVFAFRNLTNCEDTILNPKFFKMKILSTEIDKSVVVRLFQFENSAKMSKLAIQNLFVSEDVMNFFDCTIGAPVLLEPVQRGAESDLKEIEIHTKKTNTKEVLEEFKQYLAEGCKENDFILNSDVIFQVNKWKCFVKCLPPSVRFVVITQEFVRNCKLFVCHESLPEKEENEKEEFSMSRYITDVANYQEIVDKALFLFVYNTKFYTKMYNVLITGRSGSGKTVLLELIGNLLNSHPNYIYTRKVHCKSFKGKTMESLHKMFQEVFFDLIHHQPSVLILDDLHILCQNVKEGEAQQAVYFNRVSEMLESVFKDFGKHNAVGILASAPDVSQLHKNIYATRGNHLFQNTYHIQDLNRTDRLKILEFLFTDHDTKKANLAKLCEETESFVMEDLVDVAHKTCFESFQKDHAKGVFEIIPDMWKLALKSVTETSLAGVKLHSPGDKTLDDVGGLSGAKKIMLETMLWPSKYPELFDNAPLRLTTGLLIYGAPGTGKTLLAGAAAKHCGLRLISIKGPELLSKYIGASEQAVRDVFQRAQTARPCILFFDEFDSLAPRRGHDNTGVTDRVVNQLLTQLDGIETLIGVFIVAATSRPDLLDPALLRPGRLDIHIKCELPDEEARLEILQTLSKSLRLSDDVDFGELARTTRGFSGADLQAVLYTAQLDSLKSDLEDLGEENQQPEVRHERLMNAVRNTRPSLSGKEKLKYEKIYRNFEGCDSSTDFVPGTRATLA